MKLVWYHVKKKKGTNASTTELFASNIRKDLHIGMIPNPATGKTQEMLFWGLRSINYEMSIHEYGKL